jgi:AcrR family transcriptional regulator
MELLPLRERKKIKTRHAIQSAALELVGTGGYDAVTVEQIAARAEVAPATVFRYFPTKEDIIVWDDHDRDIAEFLRQRSPTEPIVRMLEAVISELLPSAAEDDPLLLKRTQLIFRTPSLLSRFRERRDTVIAAFATFLTDLRGLPADDITVEIALRSLFEAFYVATDRWQAADAERPLADYAAEAFAALTHLQDTPLRKSGRKPAAASSARKP